MRNRKRVKPGIEVFLDKEFHDYKRKRTGVLFNHASTDSDLNPTVDLLLQKGLNIVKLFAPEHGTRGTEEAGVHINSTIDRRYNLPLISLYDQSGINDLHKTNSVDESMRKFDIVREGKDGTPEMLEGIDTVFADLQDVGTRIYTYASTLFYLIERCSQLGIEIVVFDRPNPVNGLEIEGPMLEYPEFCSFIGTIPVPIRHSLTIGELAIFFNEEILLKKADLRVIPMKGWFRRMWYEDTGLFWINPSPNLPSVNSAVVYPGQVLLEGTNISEGRGTTLPFEVMGAPWIDGNDLRIKLNNIGVKGVKFMESNFSPHFSKYSGENCSGIRIVVTDREKYEPFETSLFIISEILRNYPENFKFHEKYFDHVCGTSFIRESILNGVNPDEISGSFADDLKIFKNTRKKYSLYS